MNGVHNTPASALAELATLITIARRHGAWKTADGAWVSGRDSVYQLGYDHPFCAETIEPSLQRFYYSNPTPIT